MPSSLMTFVLVVHSIIAVALVGTILLQRSEGGALGIGGGPGGLMSARGAGNLLTRATGVLAATFLGTSILLAILANLNQVPDAIDTSLAHAAVDGTAVDGATAEGELALPQAAPQTAPTGDELPFALPEAQQSDEIPSAQ